MSERERPVDDLIGSDPYSDEGEENKGSDKQSSSDSSDSAPEIPASKGLDAIKYYLKEIRKTPLLTFEQEQELAKKIEKGDQDARAGPQLQGEDAVLALAACSSDPGSTGQSGDIEIRLVDAPNMDVTQIVVTITKKDDSLTVDLTGTAPQVPDRPIIPTHTL